MPTLCLIVFNNNYSLLIQILITSNDYYRQIISLRLWNDGVAITLIGNSLQVNFFFQFLIFLFIYFISLPIYNFHAIFVSCKHHDTLSQILQHHFLRTRTFSYVTIYNYSLRKFKLIQYCCLIYSPISVFPIMFFMANIFKSTVQLRSMH